MKDEFERLNRVVQLFERDAHRILGGIENSKSRIVSMHATKAKLESSSRYVRDLFSEAVSCLENENNRAAIVMSWSGFFFQFCKDFWEHEQARLKGYNNWKITSLDELLERADGEVLTAAERLQFITARRRRGLDGRLSRRNDCAHPSPYIPNSNQAIGFVDEMIEETFKHLPT